LQRAHHNDIVVVVRPEFTGDGVLPPGIHEASWQEIVDRFGGTTHRQELLGGLRDALVDLRSAGCGRAYLDGSFVTDKEVPNDYDLCWDVGGVRIPDLTPALLDVRPPRASQHARYGGDILPNVTEASVGAPFVDFFQQNTVTGGVKGIVAINPAEVV
jgi:Family of unknown function (DUF6932)